MKWNKISFSLEIVFFFYFLLTSVNLLNNKNWLFLDFKDTNKILENKQAHVEMIN